MADIEPIEALEPYQDTDAEDTDPITGVHRVSPEIAAYIVRTKRLRPQIKQSEIAALTGLSQATVSRWLAALDNDTVSEARKLAKSNALPATMLLRDQMSHDDPRVSQGAAKAINALAGVQETGQQVSVGVQVIVGSSSAPAGPDPFDNMPVISVDKSTT